MIEFKPEITFSSTNNFVLKHKMFYKLWIILVVLSKKRLFNKINFIFTDDATILDINRKHLQHDYLTDIITFDYTEEFHKSEIDITQYEKFFQSTYNFVPTIKKKIKRLDTIKVVSGDIYISVPTVKDNAKRLNIHLYEELQRVMVHGVLHLCGQGDKTEIEQKQMRKLENIYINYLKTL